MFFARTVLALVFLASTSVGWAQSQKIPLTLDAEKTPVEVRPALAPTTPLTGETVKPGEKPEVEAAPMLEPRPPRAIIVEEPPSATPTPEVLAALPHTIPADAKIIYSQCHVPGQVIAITFDDGPNPDTTPRLLDMLKQRNIKATFFLVGKNVAAFPAVVQRIHAEGHEIGNHSWSHPLFSKLSETRVDDELKKTHDAIVEACGVAPILYRPPYGGLRLTQKKQIHDAFSYTGILWDVDPNDWQPPRTQEKVYRRVLAQTRSGSIILCHDIHKPTVDAMPATLDELRARGYQFVTVAQLINLESQTAAANTAMQLAAHKPDASADPQAPAAAVTPATTPPATDAAPAPAPAPAAVTPPVPAPEPPAVKP